MTFGTVRQLKAVWSVACSGRTAIVTGASRGIGREVALKLASVAGAHTVLACRNLTACNSAAQHIRQLSPGASVECSELDLGSLASVETFARSFQKRDVHLLVHNAGVMAAEDRRTRDGFETTFQVNHLAPFLLTLRLFPSLGSARPSRREDTSTVTHEQGDRQKTLHHSGTGAAVWGRGVRVVWVSSGLHKFGSVPWEGAGHRADGQVTREWGKDEAKRERGTMGGLTDIAHRVRV